MPVKDDTYDMVDSTKKSPISKFVIAFIAVIAIVGLITMFVLNKKDDNAAGVVSQKAESLNDQSPTKSPPAEPISDNKQFDGHAAAGVADHKMQEENVPTSSIASVNAVPSSSVVIENSVYFDFNSIMLNVNEKNRLESFYTKIKDNKGKLTIAGHADSVGTEEANKWVSMKRSESVLVYLKNYGMSNDIQVNIKGYGASKPISDNLTSDGRAKNRRAELLFVENKK